MKKVITLLFALVLVFTVASCGGDDEEAPTVVPPTDGPTVVPPTDGPTVVPPTFGPTVVPGERLIEVDYENGALYVPTERELRVAQFADTHFGVEGRDWHNDKIDRTKAYMTYVVQTTHPDFIVASGDNVIGTGISNGEFNAYDLTDFVEFMEGLHTPWTFMYGNHDAEGQSKKAYSEFLLDCVASGKTQYLVYAEDYVEEADSSVSSSDEGRYGNFAIPVYDIDNKSDLLGAYIFLDAGTYLYDQSKYQTITEGQVAWYESKINALNSEYKKEGVVPTVVFSHIQLPEHAIAYHEAYYNQTEGYEFVIRQDEIASSFETVTNQDVKVDSGLFDKMVELGSTKAYFVGHAHEYYFQVKSHGITLGYGPQCGFSKLFELNDEPRLTYVYNFDSKFDFTTTPVKEAEDLGEGFVVKYFDGKNGDSRYVATYDDETGLFTVEIELARQWARVKFYIDNEVISTADSSYVFQGDFQDICDTASLKLYPSSDPAILCYPSSQVAKFTFTYDPESKVVNILAPQPEYVDKEGLYVEYTYGSAPDTGFGNIVEPDENGNYSYEVYLATWRAAKLYFGGELLMETNANFEGLYTGTHDADWTMNLYWASDNNLMTCSGGTYIFIYNPTTNTVKIGARGLMYNVNQQAEHDKLKGLYTFKIKPAAGEKLVLDLHAMPLNKDNVTITGDFSTATSDVTGNVFYQKADEPNAFYCAGAGTYIITYNEKTNTLNFQYELIEGLSYTTRYNGTQDANPVDYKATVNADGTYTIEFQYSKAWGYIFLTYNGVKITNANTTYPTSYPTGVYYEDGGIYCNANSAALGTYVLTYNPNTNTITLEKIA